MEAQPLPVGLKISALKEFRMQCPVPCMWGVCRQDVQSV